MNNSILTSINVSMTISELAWGCNRSPYPSQLSFHKPVEFGMYIHDGMKLRYT